MLHSSDAIKQISSVSTRRNKQDEYSFLYLSVSDYTVRSSVAINPHVRMYKYNSSDTKVYDQHSAIELHCLNIDPEEPPTDSYSFTLYGYPTPHMNPDLTLDAFHARDDKGERKYRKRKGRLAPVYDLPKGMNVLEKHRGERHWSSALWLSPNLTSDMITLLVSDLDLYVECHVCHEDRKNWLVGFDLLTENPADA